MADGVSLDVFPSDRFEALAMLYLQNQDLSGKTPTELHDMYWSVLKEIQADYREKRKNGFKFRK